MPDLWHSRRLAEDLGAVPVEVVRRRMGATFTSVELWLKGAEARTSMRLAFGNRRIVSPSSTR